MQRACLLIRGQDAPKSLVMFSEPRARGVHPPSKIRSLTLAGRKVVSCFDGASECNDPSYGRSAGL